MWAHHYGTTFPSVDQAAAVAIQIADCLLYEPSHLKSISYNNLNFYAALFLKITNVIMNFTLNKRIKFNSIQIFAFSRGDHFLQLLLLWHIWKIRCILFDGSLPESLQRKPNNFYLYTTHMSKIIFQEVIFMIHVGVKVFLPLSFSLFLPSPSPRWGTKTVIILL